MEMALQYMWKYGLLPRPLKTAGGSTVEVLHPGIWNRDAGPDFSNARIRIGAEQWAGNVEVHLRASDWFRHGHDSDPAYRNVVLHVVGKEDTMIPGTDGQPIPQVAAPIPERFAILYQRLSEKMQQVECEPFIEHLTPLAVTDWMQALATERMQRKASAILDTLAWANGDWERTCFVTLARALGFSLNSDPLEMTARTLPLNILARHSDNPFQLEALLFGQAGMLDPGLHPEDAYYQHLCREYLFLARKYDLKPLPPGIWKYARTRPHNFPHRRLALLASATSGGFRLMARILTANPESLLNDRLPDWQPSEYWKTHYGFGTPQAAAPATLSKANKQLLLINFAAPLLYAYGAAHSDPDLAERGLAIWESLEAENNTFIRQWKSAGLTCTSASDSQALIQLRREYCDRNRCLECRFAYHLLKKTTILDPLKKAHT